MIKGDSEETVILVFWVFAIFISLFLGMRNDGQKHQQQQGGVPRTVRTNGFIPNSFRAFSSYLRIVSSGASTVARSAASVASSMVDRDGDTNHDQVIWAGFDKLEGEGDAIRQVLLLGYRFGFQVWDVEDTDNVCDLVSRHDGAVSFMQMLPKPIASKRPRDKFMDFRPLLVVCAGSQSGGGNIQDGLATPCNGGINSNFQSQGTQNFLPTVVRFYSLRSQSYVHILKFRSVVFSVRCSSRVVAISQATQIHCFDATTLEREYTIVTNPIGTACSVSGGIGYGPLAVGPRWLAYSGSPVAISSSGRVNPQHLRPSASLPGFSSNGSLVVHYAKESSKQFASGIVTLGDMGYKKLSRYCSELLPDGNNSPQSASPGRKCNATINIHPTDADNVGMIVVRDIVSKAVVSQFRAHRSPISALCFDPSGTILVTASVQGHNINVFKIMPGYPGGSSAPDSGHSCVHLYRLQRGFTNAVIQDISFSDDSSWILISSSRGTSHLFAISPFGGPVNIHSTDASVASKGSGLGIMTQPKVNWPSDSGTQMCKQQCLCAAGPPITLSVVSRIRNGNNGWRGTVSGAAAAATGRLSLISGAIASSFRNCEGNAFCIDSCSLKSKYHLLVFSPLGCMIQYALRISKGLDSSIVSGLTNGYELAPEGDSRFLVEAIQKWNICQRHNRREQEDNVDIYGENGISESNRIFPEEISHGNCISAVAKDSYSKGNGSLEEKYHLYISEAELQMHQSQTPLWAKPEIYFQSMVKDGVTMVEQTASGGEIEIERIPTHMIEARSKDLIPVFDYLQTPVYQHKRASRVDGKIDRQLLHQTSGLSEKVRVLPRRGSESPKCMIYHGTATSEQCCGVEGVEWDGPRLPIETKGFVNSNDSPKPSLRLEIVDNRACSETDAHLKFVNSNKEGLKMENHFEDQGDEFD